MSNRMGGAPGAAHNKNSLLPPLFPAGTPPRFLLIFFAAPLLLIAAAISGVAFSLDNAVYWLGGTFIWILWFWVMFLIVTPRTDTWLEKQRGWMRKGARVIFAVILIAGIAELLVVGLFSYWYVQSGADNDFVTVLRELQEAFRYNDGTALNQQATENLLDGENPYANANIVEAFLEHNGSYDKLTPLRVGQFANAFPYPSNEELKAVWDAAVKDTSQCPPELESHVCYPAGSFLLPAPLLAAGLKDIRVIYFLLVIGGVLYTTWLIPQKRRIIFIGLTVISLEIWNILAVGESGTIIFPFLLIAWVLIGKNNWVSAVFMGIAVATRQTAWFFLPFYLISMWQASGVKASGRAIGVTAVIFAAFNGYYIIQDPGLWLESITSPMTTQMFPLGVGVVSIVTSGLVNIQSSLPFSIMEILVFMGGIIWFARYGKKYPEAGPLLAVLPLFFAWRSLWMYFFYVNVIICAAMCMKSGDEDWGGERIPQIELTQKSKVADSTQRPT